MERLNFMEENHSVKMRATILLAGVSATAIASYPFSDTYLLANFIHHSALAATIGGLADWWGVTSLFHKPLGINGPGTDVLRKNYDRIINALAEFICNDLLSANNIIDAMKKQNLFSMIVEHFRQEKTLKELCDVVNPLVVEMLRNINLNKLEGLLVNNSSKYIESFNVYGVIINTLVNAIRKGSFDNFFDFVIKELRNVLNDEVFQYAVSNLVKDAVKNYQEDSWLRKIVNFEPQKISATILREAKVFIGDMEDSSNPIRKRIVTFMISKLEENRDNKTFINWVNKKATVLFNENIVVVKQLVVKKDADTFYYILAKKLAEVSNDPLLQESWDNSLKILLQNFIITKHDKLYELIYGKLTKYDKDSLVDTIEAKVGSDLQSIRVSGTIIGGLSGAILFMISTLAERIGDWI